MENFFSSFNFVNITYEIIDDEIYFYKVSDNFYETERVDKSCKIIGEKLIDIFSEVKEYGIYDKILKVYKTGEYLTHELKLYKDDIFNRWRFNYIYKGEKNFVCVAYQDEKCLSEISKDYIKKSNELEKIVDNMSRAFALHEMIFDKNNDPIDYKFIRINKAFELITGLGKDIIGKTVKNVLGEYSANEWINNYKKIFTEDKTLHFETYTKQFNRWYMIDAYKQNSTKFVTIFEDITEIKRKEKQNLDIINSTLSASYLTNKEGEIITANDKGCEWFEKTREELIGVKMSSLLSPEMGEYKRKRSLEAIFTGNPVYFIDNYKGKYFENYVYPILNNDGSTEYIAVHGKDITEQENIKNRLEQALLEAEKSDLLKSLFLANMSHEIRTPMNSIIGFSDVLLDPNFDDINRLKFLKTINANAKHLEELLNNILDYAKIEAGEVDLLYEKFPLNDLFDELEDIFSNVNEQKNLDLVKIIFEKREENEIIISDFLRLKQVLYNLLSNAIKFTESGHIRIGTIIKDNIITFFVEDTGIGIPENKLDDVFNKFEQVDDTSKKQHKGTGLGLSIVKSIVEILGGNIWVDSKEKEGSTFFFTLPLEEKGDIEIKEQIKPNYDFSNMNIVVIEDIPEEFSLLGIMLRAMQITLQWTSSSEESIRLIKNVEQDAVIIDISLSNVDIDKVMEKIKQIDSNVPIIAISTTNIRRSECVDFQIVKPISKEKIAEILNKIYVD